MGSSEGMGRADQVARKPLGALGSWGRGLGAQAAGRPSTAQGLGTPLEPAHQPCKPRGAPSLLPDLRPGMFLALSLSFPPVA